jgi:tetratricopeptide (TPR) repeat protein
MKRLALFLLTLILCAFFFYRVDQLRDTQALPPQLMLLPSKEMTRVVSFGHEILTAQLIFYNSMFFVGSLDDPPTQNMVRELYHTLDTATYLDPYNIDAYYFAQGVLSWNPAQIEPLNTLLRRGMAHRTWDWHLPFFYGFNQFYFLKRPGEAATYLKKAYELNPANAFLPTLIARLYYQADATEVAIEFLEEMVRNTTNENLRKWLALRLKAFRMVEFLEDGIAQYQEIYGSQPPSLEALVEGGILQAIPPDPYGGKFYLDKSGRVQTTSEFAHGKRSSANPGQ